MPGDPAAGGRSTRVTIYDIAREARVSASTVSRVMGRPGRVSFDTAEHVRKVAESLGYRPRTIRRALPTARVGVLAMVVPDITNPVFFGMILGAERTAREADCTMLLVESQESVAVEREVLDRLLPIVDGVVLLGSRLPDPEIRGAAKQRRLVVVNRLVGQVSSVLSDHLRAVKRAAEHLAERGHREITYLAGPQASYADSLRWRGLQEAGHELDLAVSRIGPGVPTVSGGAALAEQWRRNPGTAVIAYNDMVAIGFISCVTAAGIAVPGDVSVVGFDNVHQAKLVTPPLTTLATPLVTLGVTAVKHLLTDVPIDDDVRPQLLPVRLVVRDSTGRAGPAPSVD